jgi:hypothetical protein
MRMKWWIRSGVLTVLALAGLAGGLEASAALADGPRDGKQTVVSVGDSYISGEAGRWAGNTNTADGNVDVNRALPSGVSAYNDDFRGGFPGKETIPECHRSVSAEIHFPLGFPGQLAESSKNLACSGATTSTQVGSNPFKPGIDFFQDNSGHFGQALLLRDFAKTHNVRMISLSIGGNDFEFSKIVAACVVSFVVPFRTHCSKDPETTGKFDPANVLAKTKLIAGAIQRIGRAMKLAGYQDSDYTVVVQNYPSPIPKAKGFRYASTQPQDPGQRSGNRQTKGGCGFNDDDADWANDVALPTISGAVKGAIALSGMPNVTFLDVSNAFIGRRLCERTVGLLEEQGLSTWLDQYPRSADVTEWVDQIHLEAQNPFYTGPRSKNESFHPNWWGQLALRNCLRRAFNAGSPVGGACTPTKGTAFQAGLEEPSEKFTSALTAFDPLALVSRGGRSLHISGPLTCEKRESVRIDLTVRQPQSGAAARGHWTGKCTGGGARHWTVKSLAVPRGPRFRVGKARACGVKTTRAGRRTESFHWCSKPAFHLARI